MANVLKKVIAILKSKKKRTIILAQRGFYKNMSDEQFVKMQFKNTFGYDLDLSNPKTYSEKLQWLKLYNHNPDYTKMVDKYEVKKYVAELIGEEYIIPTLGVWEDFDEINFEQLPNQFVLKCTHDSGGLVICKDKAKLDTKAARKKINKSLKRNYYMQNREWPYKDVKPRIIAEKNIEPQTEELVDYKFMCFNGSVKCSFVCTERFSKDGLKVTFFDRYWKQMPFERHYPASKVEIKKPKNYEKMVYLAEVLAKEIPFVRVDFYDVEDQIYFGELTFFPGSGFEEFRPKEWDAILGEWITLQGAFQI